MVRSARPARVPSSGAVAWYRVAVALPLAAVAIWLSISVTGSAYLREASPDIALRVAPYDALSSALLAQDVLAVDPRPDKLTRAHAAALKALRRDPTAAGAWRSLALIASLQQRPADASRLMNFASQLSRRDLPTQMWLIEDEVRANNVIGALQHYDIALRTSKTGIEALLPNLVAAISHQELVEPIAELLATDPPWLPQFFSAFSQHAPASENSAEVLELLRSKGYGKSIPYVTSLPATLVSQGEFRAAYRVYIALLDGLDDRRRRDDEFGTTPRLPPFDWDLVIDGGVRAEPQLKDEGARQTTLHVVGDQATTGVAASKLVLLGPGSYVLETVVTAENASVPDRLTWIVECAGRQEHLAVVDITPPGGGRRTSESTFRVPNGTCGAQWLRLEMTADDGLNPSEAWIERLKLRALAN